jgi:hypothetical protein
MKMVQECGQGINWLKCICTNVGNSEKTSGNIGNGILTLKVKNSEMFEFLEQV